MLDTFILFTGNEDANDYIEYMTPIELPSDEEIEEASYRERYQVAFNPFASGAKWMRDKYKEVTNDN